MVQRRVYNWQSGLFRLLTVGGVASGAIVATAQGAIAQNVTLDGTLGPAQTLTGRTYRIPQSAGQTVGSNLFHSFGRFGLNADETARFESDATVRTILSRVTGRTPSTIDGVISTTSRNVNFFLINPSGIVFGPNARLNIGGVNRGSFVATTTDALVWASGERFSAINPGGADSLLTLVGDPSGFLTGLQTPGSIQSAARLSVPSGQSLILLGGDVTVNGGRLIASGGQVQVGAVEAGQVALTINHNALQLSFPDESAQATIFFSNGARIMAPRVGNTANSIEINARTINLVDTNLLTANLEGGGNVTLEASDRVFLINTRIVSDSTGAGDAGAITIHATNDVGIQHSILTATALSGGTGGNIAIETRGRVRLTDESVLTNQTQAAGNAGSISLRADGVVVLDHSSIATSSGALTDTLFGNAGDINIQAGALTLDNNSQLSTATAGVGQGGDITFNVLDGLLNITNSQVRTQTSGTGTAGNIAIDSAGSVNISGNLSSGLPGGLFTNTLGSGRAGNIAIATANAFRLFDGAVLDARTTSIGAGGDIQLTANTVEITNGGRVLTTTLGSGDAGNITVNAAISTRIIGSRSNRAAQSPRPTGLFTSTEPSSTGSGGDIDVSTNQLTVTDGAQVTASSTGTGDAGGLNITAQTVNLNNQARLSAETATSQAGNIQLRIADSLVLHDRSQISAAATQTGQGGNITVNADQSAANRVRLLSGSRLSAQANRTSNAGSVNLNARRVVVQDGAEISASTESGRGGDITLRGLESLQVNNSRVAASTQTGQAGNLTVNAADEVRLSGQGGLSVAATQGGVAGSLTVNTSMLAIANGARATVSSPSGQAGNLTVTANTVHLDQGRLSAQTGVSRGELGANIRLQDLEQLVLRNGSQISADADDRANGGNIEIGADFIVAIPSEDSDIRANAIVGRGGNIIIETQGLFGTQSAVASIPGTSDITASSEQGVQGVVQITTPDVDPSQGLTELPIDVIDASQLVARSCANGSGIAAPERSEFVITGRGGLPLSPTDPLNRDAVMSNWVVLNSPQHQERLSVMTQPINQPGTQPVSEEPLSTAPIQEAQGWVVGVDGEVRLVTEPPVVTSSHPVFASVHCIRPPA